MPFAASLPPLRILVIDDVPEDRVEIRRQLAPPGIGASWEIVDVGNAAAARAKIREAMPDCILMDHDLAETNGITLLREIIAEHGKDACGFVMLTASDSAVVAVDILKAGAHDFLHKGRTTSMQLRKAVRDAYEKASNRREVRRSRAELERKNLELAEAVEQMEGASEQRHQVEEALRKSERQFRSLADNISQLAWMTDETGAIYWYNRRWFEYTGTTLEDMRGWGWRKVHHPDHEARVVEKLSRCFAEGLHWEDTFPLRRHDGAYRWFLSRAVPIHDANAKVLGWFGTNTDITSQLETEDALKSARDKAVSASRAKDEFLAALSHELRTPLNPVLLTSSARAADSSLPDAVREDFDAIRKNVALEARLIDDLLDLTRITRGKLSLNSDVLDLGDLLCDALRIVKSDTEHKRLVWRVTRESTPVRVMGDAVRLRQVFWNVLKNAAKFTAQEGRIDVTVELRSEDNRVVVTVTDSGIGMTQAEIGRVFDAFSQGDHASSSVHRFGGLGLGLAITRSLVEMHHGEIVAHSAGLGKGTTFVVTLPLLAKDSDQTPTTPPPKVVVTPAARAASSVIGAGYRVLLVEDHAPTRTTMARLLRQRGFDVTGAGSWAEALAAASASQIDGLLTDIGLPDGDGCLLLRELRRRWPLLEGIALSGYGMEDDIKRSRQNGFVQHVTKPLEIDQLDAALAALVANLSPAKSSDA